MLLNQIVFQHQSLQLGIGNDILKPADERYHFIYLGASPDIFAEIGADTAVKIHRLPHINDGVLLVMHNVDSRTIGEFL